MHIDAMGPDPAARLLTAGMLLALGIGQIVWPRCFADIGMYFRYARRGLSPEMWERVQRGLQARREAEGISLNRMRFVGSLGILLATLEFVPVIPFAFPYAAFCLIVAASVVAAYVQVRRATERRVAPLVRRSPLDALPPAVIVATVVCLAGTLIFATYPVYRFAALAVAASGFVLLAIAWRIAASPALLLGNDPKIEYAIDERVRICRATNVAFLACGPATILTMLDSRHLPADLAFYGIVAQIVWVAFFVALIVSLMPLRRQLTLA
ncbi:MAG TPA: hypothetical protein VGF86_15520 [Candidatus Tumulicola sp.]|jgi:hypothetical protein